MVVGLPSMVNAQPSGIDSPFFAATSNLPRATADKDISITRGFALATGKAAAKGLVPKMALLPPAIGIAAGVLPKSKEI